MASQMAIPVAVAAITGTPIRVKATRAIAPPKNAKGSAPSGNIKSTLPLKCHNKMATQPRQRIVKLASASRRPNIDQLRRTIFCEISGEELVIVLVVFRFRDWELLKYKLLGTRGQQSSGCKPDSHPHSDRYNYRSSKHRCSYGSNQPHKN